MNRLPSQAPALKLQPKPVRPRPRRPVLTYVWAVAATAATALGIAVAWGVGQPRRLEDLLVFALVTVMITLARRYPVLIAPNTSMVVSTAPLYAAALLLPVHLAMTAALLGATVATAARRAPLPWFQTLFNVSEVTLRTGCGALAVLLLCGGSTLAQITPGSWLLSLPASAVAMYLVNGALVDGVVSLQPRRAPLTGFWRGRLFELPQEASLFLLGLLVAAVGARFPWALLLLAAPCFVVYRSLRDGVALKLQTRRALEQLADVIDMRDNYTFGHCRRVATMARAVAEAMKLPREEVELIEMAGRVHDVGKIGIKSTVLMKPGLLSDDEWREMSSHPEVGAQLIAGFPDFARGVDLILSHHERYDGRGYPRGLAGNAIPRGARIINVVDAFDAMTSNRAYRKAMPMDRVLEELQRGMGVQFDPAVVEIFLRVLDRHPEYVPIANESPPQDVDEAKDAA